MALSNHGRRFPFDRPSRRLARVRIRSHKSAIRLKAWRSKSRKIRRCKSRRPRFSRTARVLVRRLSRDFSYRLAGIRTLPPACFIIPGEIPDRRGRCRKCFRSSRVTPLIWPERPTIRRLSVKSEESFSPTGEPGSPVVVFAERPPKSIAVQSISRFLLNRGISCDTDTAIGDIVDLGSTPTESTRLDPARKGRSE